MFPPKKKKTDIENAADAKMPGDKKEDAKDMKTTKGKKPFVFKSKNVPTAAVAAQPMIAKKLMKAAKK